MRKPRSRPGLSPAPLQRMERVAMPTGRQAAGRESHGSASPPAPLHRMERVAAGRERSYRLGAPATKPHRFSGWPVSLPTQISHCEKFEEGSSEVLGAQSWGLVEHARRTEQSRAWVSLISANHAKC